MRVLLLLFFALPLHAEDWIAGSTRTVRTPNLPAPAKVLLPSNWTPERAWPAVFFYPWTGGPADTEMMRTHTHGRDFIIVGMPPRDAGAFRYTPETFKLEQFALRETRDLLAAQVRLDPARVYVAGFSKGGWLSALLLAHEQGLAGGIIMGGGWMHHQHVAPAKPKRPVHVYVGIGRLDGNFPPALRAAREFGKLGAGVHFDVWPNTGHELPEGGATGLIQWLALAARGRDAFEDAERWAASEFARINAREQPVWKWDELRRLSTRPFIVALGGEWKNRIAARITELEKIPEVAAEAALDRELAAIHEREIQDMRVTTLEAVGPRYEALAKRAPASMTGLLAAHDAARIKRLWETVPGEDR